MLLPSIRPAFQDVRYDLPLADALHTTFVVIPLGMVAFEEPAFPSLLCWMLSRHLRPWQVLETTRVFGHWPSGFGELRRRSGSVLASAGAPGRPTPSGCCSGSWLGAWVTTRERALFTSHG